MEKKLTDNEYTTRLLEIRVKVNELLDDLGVTYDTAPEMLEKVLNNAMNGDLLTTSGGMVKTAKIIVCNFHAVEWWRNSNPKYI